MKANSNCKFKVTVTNEFTGAIVESFNTDSKDQAKAKYDKFKADYTKDVKEFQKKNIASDYNILLTDKLHIEDSVICHIYTDYNLNVKLEECA